MYLNFRLEGTLFKGGKLVSRSARSQSWLYPFKTPRFLKFICKKERLIHSKVSGKHAAKPGEIVSEAFCLCTLLVKNQWENTWSTLGWKLAIWKKYVNQISLRALQCTSLVANDGRYFRAARINLVTNHGKNPVDQTALNFDYWVR